MIFQSSKPLCDYSHFLVQKSSILPSCLLFSQKKKKKNLSFFFSLTSSILITKLRIFSTFEKLFRTETFLTIFPGQLNQPLIGPCSAYSVKPFGDFELLYL